MTNHEKLDAYIAKCRMLGKPVPWLLRKEANDEVVIISRIVEAWDTEHPLREYHKCHKELTAVPTFVTEITGAAIHHGPITDTYKWKYGAIETTISTKDLHRLYNRAVDKIGINVQERQLEYAELFGMPVLFIGGRVSRESIPKGFYCYDIRGEDCDPDKMEKLENLVIVNHAGAVIIPTPITIPKCGFREIGDKLKLTGEQLTINEFCDRQHYQ